MERYNQGFGKFGPMEQCKDGEWVRYEDAEKEFDELKELFVKANDSVEDYWEEKLKRERKNTLFFATLAAVELVIPVIVYFIFR